MRFHWLVLEDGYQWVEAVVLPSLDPDPRLIEHPAPIWALTDGELISQIEMRSILPYEPLVDETGLFRNFAEVEPTREGILAFANRYGMLSGMRGGHTQTLIYQPAWGPFDPDKTVSYGETLVTWQSQIQQMKQAVDLWDWAQSDDHARLASVIVWDASGAWHVASGPVGDESRSLVVNRRNAGRGDSRADRVREPNLRTPALYRVQDIINNHLDNFANHLTERLDLNPATDEFDFSPVPDSLIAALWLQFAEAVKGNKTYDRCEVCGKWFERNTKTGRANRRYCSDTCRRKAYWQRRARQGTSRALGTLDSATGVP